MPQLLAAACCSMQLEDESKNAFEFVVQGGLTPEFGHLSARHTCPDGFGMGLGMRLGAAARIVEGTRPAAHHPGRGWMDTGHLPAGSSPRSVAILSVDVWSTKYSPAMLGNAATCHRLYHSAILWTPATVATVSSLGWLSSSIASSSLCCWLVKLGFCKKIGGKWQLHHIFA